MPHAVPIEVFCIAKTQADREAVRKWLDFIGVSEDFQIPDSETLSDPSLIVALAAKRCYKSFEPSLNPNVTKVRTDWTEYLDNVLASKHGSVCEHATYTFAIENVSRVFTGECNRHRAGFAISEGSMRYIRYEDIPYWLPTLIAPNPDDSADLARKKAATAAIIREVFYYMEVGYSHIMKIWDIDNQPFAEKKKITSMARRIIGMGVATGGVWTGNLRALRHIMSLRCDPSAEEEICHVFSRIGKIMIESEPALFGDFTETPDGFLVPKYWKV